MVDPCDPVPAGETFASLAIGYTHNTGCLWMYRDLLEQQRLYKKELVEIYGNK